MFHAGRRHVGLGGLLALSLAFVSASPSSDETVLVRVDKLQAAVPPADLVARMRVVQEFEQAWLVTIPESDAARLSESGVSHRVLRAVSGQEAVFVVSGSEAADIDALKKVGEVWPIDANASLLVTTDEDVRERIAPHLRLKRLVEGTDLLPAFRLAGRTQAVARPRLRLDAPGDARIPQLVGLVNREAIRDTIGALEGFQTRYASTSSCTAAGEWLLDSFLAMGLAVERDSFTFGTGGLYSGNNIVATLPGRTSPDQVVMVTAHYDSYSTDPTRFAPGADDNGSGTAVVLELARVLSAHSFDFTIRFIAFSAEEFGLYGSKHYAQAARTAGENIVAVVNLDMVAYADRLPEDLDLVVNSRSEWLAAAFAGAAAAWAPMPTVKIRNASFTYSDHAPFWDQGYSAMCGIEDMTLTNPNYHRAYDTFSTLNMDFALLVARASLATVAMLAQPFESPAPPATITVQSQLAGTLFMRAKTAYLTWSAPPGATAYNVYRTTTSRSGYQRLNRTPLTTTSFADRFLPATVTYYYVVASLDGGGNEGNYSKEAVLAGATIR